jgi:hypothetical protein
MHHTSTWSRRRPRLLSASRISVHTPRRPQMDDGWITRNSTKTADHGAPNLKREGGVPLSGDRGFLGSPREIPNGYDTEPAGRREVCVTSDCDCASLLFLLIARTGRHVRYRHARSEERAHGETEESAISDVSGGKGSGKPRGCLPRSCCIRASIRTQEGLCQDELLHSPAPSGHRSQQMSGY